MNRERIRDLLEQLDQEVSKKDALLRIHKQASPYGNVLIGNEKGLLRFGIHSLEYGLNLSNQRGNKLESFSSDDLDYLQGDELEPYGFLRQESIEKLTKEESQEQSRLDLTLQVRIFIYLIVAFFCMLMLLGSYTAIHWLMGLF